MGSKDKLEKTQAYI